MSLTPEIVSNASGGSKTCSVCMTDKPATAFYFHRDKSSYDGWCPVCKECRKEARQKKVNSAVAKNLQDLGLETLKNIRTGKIRAPMCDVVSGGEIILQAFGGIEGLAAKLAADYESSDVGSASRTKLLLGALMFVAKGMEMQQPMDLSHMSDEDLKRALEKAIGVTSDDRRITEEPENNPSVGG